MKLRLRTLALLLAPISLIAAASVTNGQAVLPETAASTQAISAAAVSTPTIPAPTIVIFFAQPQSAAVWPAFEDAFPREAAKASVDLPPNLRLVSSSDLHTGAEFGKLVQVHLLGRCDVPEQAERPISRGPLGWVPEVSGEIQPFVYVQCDRVAQYLGPALLGMNAEGRAAAMATAIARICVHEWLHVTLQSDEHTSHGIRQAQLTADELIQAQPTTPSGN